MGGLHVFWMVQMNILTEALINALKHFKVNNLMHRQSVMLFIVMWIALWEEKIKWVVFQSSRNYMGSSVNWKVRNHFPIPLCLKMNNRVKLGIFSWCFFSYSIFRKCELKNFSLIPTACQRNWGCQKYGAGRDSGRNKTLHS